MFAFFITYEIMHDDYESRSIIECRQRHNWPKCEEVIQLELTSLTKRDVLGPIARTPKNVKSVGFK